MRHAILALGLLIGCDDGGDGAPIEPTSGTWGYLEGDVFDDACHYPDPETSPMGTFTLTNNGDRTMTITPTSEAPFSCTISGASFTCPDRANSDLPVPTLDATVHLHVATYGSFSSPTAASGHQRIDATCTGTQCDVASAAVGVTFPCGFSVRYTASLVTR
ncbi:MAG: hypothetical protein HY905_27730 [Deltaproteobacteria bacterium]|nr:hypothetical protein [Deltaproteobacteria bacterium]